MKIKVVFFASPDIALKSFEALIKSDEFEVCALVTQPPKPSGRGKKTSDSLVKSLAAANNIEVLEPVRIAKEPAIVEKLKSYGADFFVTFAFGQILSQEVLDIPKFETINLHASLLPKYRGANPICECLLRGDCLTGITTMITTLELDAGDICLTEQIPLDSDVNFPSLSRKIAELSPDLIIKTLKGLYENSIKPYPQDVLNVTFTKKIKKSDKVLSFENKAEDVHNKVRAMCGINTCHFQYKGKLIKVIKTAPQANNDAYKPGEVINVNKDGIMIACMDGNILIETVKPEGRCEMSAYNWSLGSKIQKGEIIQCIQEE